MKLPLLNILRTSKVFAIVLGLHLFVFSILLFHPGCQMSQSAAPQEPSAPMGEVTSLDNATLAEPTRPEGSSTVSMNEIAAPAIEPSMSATDSSAASTPVSAPTSYTVQKGDSLWSIARKNGVTVAALAEMNGISRNSVLKVGQTLQVPPASMAPATSESKPAKKKSAHSSSSSSHGSATYSGPSETYVVQAGDSLGKIAKMHGTSVRAIKGVNGLHSDIIRVGQKLKVPAAKTEAAAPAADTTSTSTDASAPVISTSESTTTPETVAPAPAADSSAPAADVTAPTSMDEGNTTTHKVQAGESPAVIAKKYGMKTSELIALNNITDPRKLKIGQELKVKAPAAAPVEAAASTDSTSSNMSVEALDAATSTTSEAAAPVVEVKPASTLQ